MFARENVFCCTLNLPEELKKYINTVAKINADSSEHAWLDCLDIIGDFDGYLGNAIEGEDCPFPSRRWTFLHHAAYYNTPVSVLKVIKESGFVMSFKDFEGLTARDHIKSTCDISYKEFYKPSFKIKNFNTSKVNNIEKSFHAVINSRAKDLVQKHNLILPSIAVLLEEIVKENKYWYAVPGMYGGFTISFEFNSDKTDVDALVTSSWCRVVGGSGQTHRCTENNWTLTDEGFV